MVHRSSSMVINDTPFSTVSLLLYAVCSMMLLIACCFRLATVVGGCGLDVGSLGAGFVGGLTVVDFVPMMRSTSRLRNPRFLAMF